MCGQGGSVTTLFGKALDTHEAKAVREKRVYSRPRTVYYIIFNSIENEIDGRPLTTCEYWIYLLISFYVVKLLLSFVRRLFRLSIYFTMADNQRSVALVRAKKLFPTVLRCTRGKQMKWKDGRIRKLSRIYYAVSCLNKLEGEPWQREKARKFASKSVYFFAL